jgi:hypothetical protein
MKSVFLSVLFCFVFFKMDAQSKGKKDLFQFITIEKDTIMVYANEVKVLDSIGFELTNTRKIFQLREAYLLQAFYCENYEKVQIFFQHVLASSVPGGDLYISTSGDNYPKILFFRNSIIQCSEPLLRAIKSSLESIGKK